MTPASLADVAWPVRTERLLLRPATVADLEVVWTRWRQGDDVGRWLSEPAPPLDVYLEHLGTPERLATILVAEHEDQVVMDLHLRVQNSYAQSEVAKRAAGTKANLGWTMDPRVHGRGLATEGLRAALGICFDGLGVHRVEADCFAANTASWRLMERVGMRREAHFVEASLHRELGWTDMYAYGMLALDWKALNHA
ncbi:putative acetyltransferase [Janibacter sp. HTCC2649]|uniref:GNAT family N-acetyltransferase n=1 Tax=Janibacter sp. HTCC2649 TaxID=313589 RepID=UPI00006708AE|nr:GNAT family protein [Janibacter sp. HTCC2649]EAQ00953.1 putative acetyltransferase [Janibacter sp. HTCC2649]